MLPSLHCRVAASCWFSCDLLAVAEIAVGEQEQEVNLNAEGLKG